MFTFLHAADIHLDSPLVGLARFAGAPVAEVRGATRRVFANLVGLALAEQVAFVLLAGDLYDGDWKDYNTGLFFAAEMARLKEAGIPVLVVSGNHDAANQFTRTLRTPDNVFRFPAGHPETHLLGDLPVAVHGRSFATKAVEEDLAAGFPAAVAGCFNIGLLHTSLDGRPGHASYAPCTLAGLRSKRYQYWALGHVHAREVVAQDPWVVFPGNPQGRHARETGAKGCTLVTVDDNEVVAVREQALDVVRWRHCRVDLGGAATGEETLERVGRELEEEVAAADGRLLALRLELAGSSGAHADLTSHPEHWEQELRALVMDRAGEGVWLEKVVLATSPLSARTADAAGNEALAGLLRTVHTLEEDTILLDELRRDLADLGAKLPPELLDPASPDFSDPTDPQVLTKAMVAARDLLLARLTGDGG
jgi:DNA repair protein SbcD/Mre11